MKGLALAFATALAFALVVCLPAILALRSANSHNMKRLARKRQIINRLRTKLSPAGNLFADTGQPPPGERRRRFHPPVSQSTDIVGRRVTRYESSALEMAWVGQERRGQICQLQREPAQVEGAHAWISYSSDVFLPGKSLPRRPTDAEYRALSHFFVGAHNHTEPIEPLTGVARHPAFGPEMCTQHAHLRQHLFDIDYLVIHNGCGRHHVRGRKVVFLDLGASRGFEGIPGGVPETMPRKGGGISPSIPLFYRMYADRCLEFDEIYAWEIFKRISGVEFWGELPPALRKKVHFYELPVSEDRAAIDGKEPEVVAGKERAAAASRAGSFVRFLEEAVAPEDFAVIKVDIDNSEVELNIVEAIATRPELTELVDELFFEYQ